MKKTLIALAGLTALATSTATMAQSSVTLFGIVDATFAYGKGSAAKRTQLSSGGYNTSRLGFRGTEDLGGGLAASFWLEAGLSNDNGSSATTNTNNQNTATSTTGGGGLNFGRRSTVSLSGGFGELRLGRDYTPQFWNLVVFDPFGVVGVGNTLTFSQSLGGPVNTRASNSIGYFLPSNLGGFYGQFQYYMGENLSNAANKKDGTGAGVRVGYAKGPLNVAIAASSTDYLPGDIKSWNFGASYDMGMAQLIGQYSQDKVDAVADVNGKSWLLGALVPLGPGQIRLAYSTYKADNAVGADPRNNKISLGYVHNLSKRTALYTTFARVSNKGGATLALNGSVTAANTNSTGFDLGLRHSF